MAGNRVSASVVEAHADVFVFAALLDLCVATQGSLVGFGEIIASEAAGP
jgi:hypothetical protein